MSRPRLLCALILVIAVAWGFRLPLINLLAPLLPKPFFLAHECWFDAPTERPVTCGYLYVHADRAASSSGAMRLPVVRLLAAGARKGDPVLYLAGGPSSALGPPRWTPAILEGLLEISPWLEGRDLIVFDYRGTGRSRPSLTCAGLPYAAMTLSSQQEAASALEACARRRQRRGIDLTLYSTPAIADDVEDLRAALGVEQLTLWAESYGTRVALELMRADPEWIRSVILQGVFPPEVGDPAYTYPAYLYRLLRHAFAYCLHDVSCKEATDDLEAHFRAALASVRNEPISVKIDLPRYVNMTGFDEQAMILDSITFLDLIADQAYTWEGIRHLPQYFDAVINNDAELLENYINEYLFYQWISFIDPLHFYAIHCNDVGPMDEARWQEETKNLSVFKDWLEDTTDVCKNLKHAPRPALSQETVTSDIPTLLIAGAFDPVTPPEWAAQAARSLSNAHLYVFPYSSHDAGRSSCARHVIADFLSSPQTHARHPCVAQQRPVPFVMTESEETS